MQRDLKMGENESARGGDVVDLVTSAQMRAIERAEIDSGSVTGWALMSRAGHGCYDRIAYHFPEVRRALVLCGPGNNGGDGYVVAADLAAAGVQVTVAVLGDPAHLPPDAARARAGWDAVGASVDLAALNPVATLGAVDLVVDALFGIGLTRDLGGAARDWALACAAQDAPPVVAVDIPSGLSGDDGAVLGAAFRADLTVTFHARKFGHVRGQGPAYCGVVEVVDIGLPRGPSIGPKTERP
jgi:hydroxyethylthiazole kinase-like uncharacterized protein yjeF